MRYLTCKDFMTKQEGVLSPCSSLVSHNKTGGKLSLLLSPAMSKGECSVVWENTEP